MNRLFRIIPTFAIVFVLAGSGHSVSADEKSSNDFSFEGVKNVVFLVDLFNLQGLSFKQWKERKLRPEKSLVSRVIAALPEDVPVGLRVFGTGIANQRFIQDPEVVPLAQGNRLAIMKKLSSEFDPVTSRPGQEQFEDRIVSPAVEKCLANDLQSAFGRTCIVILTDGNLHLPARQPSLGPQFLHGAADHRIQIIPVVTGLEYEEVPGLLNALARSTKGRVYDKNSIEEFVHAVEQSNKK